MPYFHHCCITSFSYANRTRITTICMLQTFYTTTNVNIIITRAALDGTHRKHLLFTCDLYLGSRSQNVAKYHLHHVTYSIAKFKIAASNGLEDAFTRKHIIWLLTLGSRSYEALPSTLYIIQGRTKYHTLPSTTCNLCIYKIWSCYVQLLRRRCI